VNCVSIVSQNKEILHKLYNIFYVQNRNILKTRAHKFCSKHITIENLQIFGRKKWFLGNKFISNTILIFFLNSLTVQWKIG